MLVTHDPQAAEVADRVLTLRDGQTRRLCAGARRPAAGRSRSRGAADGEPMRVQTLLYFYGRRLRTHPIQELLAGLGIAIGVALAFAVLVANGSITGSANQILQAVVGRADLQLQARDARGFDAHVLDEVERVAGRAAGRSAARAARGAASARTGAEVAVNLGSLDPRLAALSGRLAGNFVTGGFRFLHGDACCRARRRRRSACRTRSTRRS